MGSSTSKIQVITPPQSREDIAYALSKGVTMRSISQCTPLRLIDTTSSDFKWDFAIIFSRKDMEQWFYKEYLHAYLDSQGY